MTRCGQRTGFLTFATCTEEAAATCMRCGKLICAMHVHTGPAGTLCPDCAVIGLDEDEASRHGLYSSYHRSYIDTYSGYAPSDYDSFEAGGGEMGGGGASGDWDSADDGVISDAGGEGGGAFQDS